MSVKSALDSQPSGHPEDSNPLNTSPADTATLSRVERKRLAARGRIIAAAAQLFRQRAVEDVTIQDITAAADVGHGSFYLHFESKHDVLLPIMRLEAQRIDQHLQDKLGQETDAARVLAMSARYMGYTIVADDLWRWMLTTSGVPTQDLRQAFGTFSERDFDAGVASGRFQVADVAVSNNYIFGGYVSVLLASFSDGEPHAMIDGAVQMMLYSLGVPSADALELAHEPIQNIL